MLQKLEGVLGSSKILQGSFLRARPSKPHEDSVDIESQILIDYNRIPQWKRGQLCWEAKGPIAALYRDLGRNLVDELRRTVARAKPIIIISGGDKHSREEAKSNIIRSNLLANSDFEIGLLRYPPSGPIKPVAMDDLSTTRLPSSPKMFPEVYFDPNDELRSIGMPIYIKTGESSIRKATANVVYNGNNYGYVTAAHAFKESTPTSATLDHDDDDDDEGLGIPFDSDSDSDSESDDDPDVDDEDGESSLDHTAAQSTIWESELTGSRMSCGYITARTRPIQSGELLVRTDKELNLSASLDRSSSTPLSGLQLLGNLSVAMTSLDCAVIEVTNKELVLRLAELRDLKDERRPPICAARPIQSQVVAWTSHGPVRGKIADLPILMQVPGSNSYEHAYRFTYEGDIKMGDCGTFVTNAETKELYGLVIGKSESGCTAYMMAAEKIVHEIEKSGAWQYLGMRDAEFVIEHEHPSLDRERSEQLFKTSTAPYNRPESAPGGSHMGWIDRKSVLSEARDQYSINSARGAMTPEARPFSNANQLWNEPNSNDRTLNISAYTAQDLLGRTARIAPSSKYNGAIDWKSHSEYYETPRPRRALKDDKQADEQWNYDTLNRPLERFHIFMIAMSSVVGIGLYIGAGNILSLGGPLALLMSYALLGGVTISVTQCLLEMVSIRPIFGDISVFVTEFVDADLGTAMGVAYWLTYTMSFAALVTATGELAQYWELSTGIHECILFLLVPAILVAVNAFGIRLFGMIEVISGALKLFLLLIVTVGMYSSAGSGPKSKTLHYPEKIIVHDSDATNSWAQAFFMSLSIAAFAFIGVETIATSAVVARFEAKSRSPFHARTIRQVIESYAVYISTIAGVVYVLASVLLSLNIVRDDPGVPRMSWVTNSEQGGMRPTVSAFALVAEESKIPGLASTLNVFLIFTALTCANSNLYIASRSLYSLTMRLNGGPGQPWYIRFLACFRKTNNRGVPLLAVLVSFVFAWIPFFLFAVGRGLDINTGILLDVLSTVASTGIVIVWACQCWAYIRLYNCIQNNHEEFHEAPLMRRWYGNKADGFPYRIHWRLIATYASLAACLFILVVANSACQWKDFNVHPLLSAYLGPICFILLWVLLKVMKKSRWQLVDISRGGALAERLLWFYEPEWIEPEDVDVSKRTCRAPGRS